MQTIGAILGGPSARRTHEPVRRSSHKIGHCEARIWRPTHRQDVRRITLAARRYDLLGRQKGQRNGPLGHVGIELLDLLANLVSFKTGQLDPSLDYLMDKLRRSRGAIVEALAKLRAHGFLDWLRRFDTVEREGPGPRVRQVSNAYRLNLPARAMRLLGRFAGGPPLPDDVAQLGEERRASVEAHKAALPLDEVGAFTVEDDPLGQALGQLGRLVEQRESTKRSESKTTT